MKVLFLTPHNTRPLALVWSGIALRMVRGIEALDHSVEVQSIETNSIRPWGGVKRRIYWRMKKHYMCDFDPLLRWAMRKKLNAQLKNSSFDLVFSWLPWLLPLVETDKPKIFWYDTTFIKTQPLYYANLCNESRLAGFRLDGEIARQADAAIYSSQWACDSAIQDYAADPKRVHLIPFGANFTAPDLPQVEQAIDDRISRRAEPMRLLFVGVDWHRKGGMVAVEVMREINRRGTPARLTVAGCSRDLAAEGVPGADCAKIEVVGRLNKTVPQELAKLQSLYLESDFFIMPSRAESLGIVYIEAMACGLPSLATATGGVATAVRDGVTGRIVQWGENTVNELADYAIQTRNDSDGYKDLCRHCAQIFEAEYRWEVGFRRLGEIMERLTHQS